MNRYIDADKLLEYLEKEAESEDVKYSFIGAGVQATINEIKKFHLEDVKPVIHAHWKRNFQRQGVYKDLWLYCSNCNGRTSEEYAPYWWLYCPYCGARMDEEVDDG